jgi:hypothetical protein
VSQDFFPWAVIFLGVLGLSLMGFWRTLKLLPHLALATLVALAITAPYWANGLLISKQLLIPASFAGVGYAELSSWRALFSPIETTDPFVTNVFRRFNLQIGPIILAAICVAPLYARTSRAVLAVLAATIMSCLFVCSFFAFPNMWIYLPPQLAAVQFPYRLLIFATSFGLVLAGLVLSFSLRIHRSASWSTFAALCIFSVIQFWWTPTLSGASVTEAARIGAPNGSNDYFEVDRVPLSSPGAIVDRSLVKASGNQAELSFEAQAGRYVLPVQYSRNLVANLNGKLAAIGNDKGLVSIELEAGKAEIHLARIEPVDFQTGALVAGTAFFMLTLLFWLRRRPFESARYSVH